MTLNRRNIEFILANEIDRAKAVFDAAKKKAIAAPTPEDAGSRVLENSYRAAMDTYARALTEFQEFVVRAIVPERLKEAERGRAHAAQSRPF